MTGRDDLVASTELLNAELPDPRFVDDAYLQWLYVDNPHGASIQRSIDEGGVRLAHYAVIPQEYRDAQGPIPCVFSLNAVVRSGTQRKGYFTRIGLEIYEEAAAAGFRFVVGVSNEKSVGAVVKYMGWRHVGPLPVRVVPATAWSVPEVAHHPVTAALLVSSRFDALVEGLDEAPATLPVNRWTPRVLRWRLACPHTSYVLHTSPSLVAVSTGSRAFGVPAAVMLKLLPRGSERPPAREVRRLFAAVARYHRAPCAVYAGFNQRVPVWGLAPPRRVQPSPLHLILRALAPEVDQRALTLGTFEFLDFDAY